MFNPFASSYRSLPIPSVYARHEKEKRDRYEERVREVERAAFTPLVFAATGGAGKLTTAFLKRVAVILAEKNDEAYCTTNGLAESAFGFQSAAVSHSLSQELTPKGLMRSG